VRGRTLIAASAVAVTLAGATPASSVTPLERSALKALATTRVTPTTKERGRAEIRRAAYLAHTLPSGRREHVAVALGEIASFAGKLTEPRALALIGELKANDDYFLQHWAPQPKTDITDADGIVYRYFAGRCFEFHPLANFGALNARVAAGDIEGSQRLADALVARGVYQASGGIGWEYTFPYAGGRAPWLSGMAQAVAAQALARTAGLVQVEATSLMGKARAAYQAIPGRLLTSVAAGPWIRLYSFTSLPVLNAQLQTVISLQSYATTAEDADAAALALRMQRAAAATLTRFDTGYWSYYALPNDPSPLDYHEYVVQLLQRLKSADPRFADAAVRFAAYEKQPPAFQLAPGSLGALTFWISKPSTVSVVTGAGPSRRVSVDGLAYAFVEHAQARRRISGACDGDRRGREPRIVRRAADRACELDGGEARDAIDRRDRPSACPVIPCRCGTRRPVAVLARGAGGPAPHAHQRDVATGRHRAGPGASHFVAATRSDPDDRRTTCDAAPGRRHRTRGARAVRGDTRCKRQDASCARPRSGAARSRHRGVRDGVRRDPRCAAELAARSCGRWHQRSGRDGERSRRPRCEPDCVPSRRRTREGRLDAGRSCPADRNRCSPRGRCPGTCRAARLRPP